MIIKEEDFKNFIIEKDVVEKYVNHCHYYLPLEEQKKEQYTLQDIMNIARLLRYQVIDLIGSLEKEREGEDY